MNSIDLVRRQFLTSSASGLGMLALASLLRDDGLLAADAEQAGQPANPLAPKAPHFAPKAKNCICIFPKGRRARSTCSTPSRSSTSCTARSCPSR